MVTGATLCAVGLIWRWARGVAIAAGMITLIVLGVLASRNHLAQQPDPRLNLALSGMLLLVLLLFGPLPLASHDTGVHRKRSTARLGWYLDGGVWLLQCLLTAYGSYYLAGQLEREFQPILAGLALLGSGFTLIRLWARHLNGIDIEWSFLRGAAGLRYLANRIVLAAIAGAWLLLAYWVWFLPSRAYRWLSDVTGTAWLAVPGTLLSCLLLLVMLGLLQRLAVRLLGADNAVGRWLDEHSLVVYQRTRDGTYINFLGFRYTNTFPAGPSRWQYERMRQYMRTLLPDEERELLRRIEEAMVAYAPDWDRLRLDYRAVTEHQEITLTVTRASGPAVEQLQLPDFPARDALWRLREAGYSAGYGAPYSWYLELSKYQPGSGPDRRYTASYQSISQYDMFGMPVPLDDEEPAWVQSPTRAQYAADLRRFPIVRAVRPAWLRRRLRHF